MTCKLSSTSQWPPDKRVVTTPKLWRELSIPSVLEVNTFLTMCMKSFIHSCQGWTQHLESCYFSKAEVVKSYSEGAALCQRWGRHRHLYRFMYHFHHKNYNLHLNQHHHHHHHHHHHYHHHHHHHHHHNHKPAVAANTVTRNKQLYCKFTNVFT